jgi:uncharacterized lipoprotein
MNICRLLFVCAGLSLLSGCIFFTDDLEKCREQREYHESDHAPRVNVPTDLQDLSKDQYVDIPYGETNRVATDESLPCLIEPPDFFDQEPV